MLDTHKLPVADTIWTAVAGSKCSKLGLDLVGTLERDNDITTSLMFNVNGCSNMFQSHQACILDHLFSDLDRSLQGDLLASGRVRDWLLGRGHRQFDVCLFVDKFKCFGCFYDSVCIQFSVTELVVVESAGRKLFPVIVVCADRYRRLYAKMLQVAPRKLRTDGKYKCENASCTWRGSRCATMPVGTVFLAYIRRVLQKQNIKLNRGLSNNYSCKRLTIY